MNATVNCPVATLFRRLAIPPQSHRGGGQTSERPLATHAATYATPRLFPDTLHDAVVQG